MQGILIILVVAFAVGAGLFWIIGTILGIGEGE